MSSSRSFYRYMSLDGTSAASASSSTTPPPQKQKKKRNVSRKTLPEAELRALRLRDAERKRTRRQNMSEAERTREREKDKARKALKRRQQRLQASMQPVLLPPVSHILSGIPESPPHYRAPLPQLPRPPPHH